MSYEMLQLVNYVTVVIYINYEMKNEMMVF